MTEHTPQKVPFSVPLARELTTFENQVGLERALKWRLNEACDEIERLEEQLEALREACEAFDDSVCDCIAGDTKPVDLLGALDRFRAALNPAKKRPATVRPVGWEAEEFHHPAVTDDAVTDS